MQQVEIRVKGQIDRDWSDYFSRLTMNCTPQGETNLNGSVRDQAELRGILTRLTDLGLELISVTTKPKVHRLSRAGGDCRTKRRLN